MTLDESLAKLTELNNHAAELTAFSPEELHQLKEASLVCALANERTALAPLLQLATLSPAFAALPEDDWEIAYLHRILGSVATAEHLDQLRAGSDNSQLPLSIREQLFMAITFMALEKRITTDELSNCYKQIIAHAAENRYEERLAMGLIINFAVFCGQSMRKDLDAFLPLAKISGEEAASIKQAAGLIAQEPAKFRTILQGQHKGAFSSLEAELPNLDKPVVEEVNDMPHKVKPIVRTEPKIGRNDPCPCGSGKKYKKCCGKDK